MAPITESAVCQVLEGVMDPELPGLIENMSYFECPVTDKRYEIFGPSHAEETAQRIGTPFLGQPPIDLEIARRIDHVSGRY